ncbi:hypothetical protein [Lactococcus petauri]
MAQRDMNTNFLLDSVNKDIRLYGSGFRVYVVYKQGVIISYVEADKPVKDEGEKDSIYALKLQEFKKNIKKIQGAHKKLMTLGEFQDILNLDS